MRRRGLGIIIVGSLGLAAAAVAGIGSLARGTRPTIRTTSVAAHASLLARALRPNYPYSVIPGGVYTPAELRAAVERDPQVREHYEVFDLSKLRVVKLTEDHYAFLSFRQNGRILWTRRKVLIPRGELLLTDGTHYAKTRCGNRLSETKLAWQPSGGLVNADEPALHQRGEDSKRTSKRQVPRSALPDDYLEGSGESSRELESVLSPPPLEDDRLSAVHFVQAPAAPDDERLSFHLIGADMETPALQVGQPSAASDVVSSNATPLTATSSNAAASHESDFSPQQGPLGAAYENPLSGDNGAFAGRHGVALAAGQEVAAVPEPAPNALYLLVGCGLGAYITRIWILKVLYKTK